MTDVAIVKPDHIGDFMLSVPALRALLRKFGQYDLFATPGNRFVQEFFLPDGVSFHPVKFAHLQKDSIGDQLGDFLPRVKSYSLVVFLRDDGFCRDVCSILGSKAVITHGNNLTHESKIQQLVTETLTGSYSRTQMFWPDKALHWPNRIECVGISLSAGFFANKIPSVCLLRLAQSLIKKHSIRVKLIGGPLEIDELQLMARMLDLSQADVVLGGTKLEDFYQRVGECDVVIGGDSGTMHLVSAKVPVLGIFTSSPWQRFSPFGASNRVLYSDVPCSPCIQFSKNAFNGCMSRECAALISAEDIENALLSSPSAGVTKINRMLRLVVGPSHVQPAGLT